MSDENKQPLTKEQQMILDFDAIQTKLSGIVGQVTTIQQSVHELLIESTCFAFNYKDKGNDCIAKILNTLTSVKGSFRVESLAYWYSHIAGIEASFNGSLGSYSCKLAKDRYKSDKSVEFTYDSKHVSLIKKEEFRFWKIAPVVIKDLKLPLDIDKATQSAEIMLARALAGGSLDEDSIKSHISNMFDRVKQLSSSGKTKEWLEDFYLQHPDQRPVSIEPEQPSDLVEESQLEEAGSATPMVSAAEFRASLEEDESSEKTVE